MFHLFGGKKKSHQSGDRYTHTHIHTHTPVYEHILILIKNKIRDFSLFMLSFAMLNRVMLVVKLQTL